MEKRLKKALQALLMVVGITVACLAFMPWQVRNVVEPLDEANRCMILRYDQSYSTAYPMGDELEQLLETLGGSHGQFDRARGQLTYYGEEPLYRIFLWTPEGRIPDVWVCGPAFFYEGSQFMLNDADAAALDAMLASCFS